MGLANVILGSPTNEDHVRRGVRRRRRPGPDLLRSQVTRDDGERFSGWQVVNAVSVASRPAQPSTASALFSAGAVLLNLCSSSAIRF
jgi:hypothetical protein